MVRIWPFRRVVAVITNKSADDVGDDSRAAANWAGDVRFANRQRAHCGLSERVKQASAEAEESHSEHHQRGRRLPLVDARFAFI